MDDKEYVRRRVVEPIPARIEDIGRGIPNYFMPLVNRRRADQPKLKKELTPSEFSAFSASLNLEEYKFDDEITKTKVDSDEIELDITALDRYNDEVRRYRKILIDECRQLPSNPTPEHNLEVLEDAIEKLCRNAYYGTAKAQRLAEGAVPLLVWLLNRKYFEDAFIMHTLKSISELCWTAVNLKAKFKKSHGVKVLYQRMTFITERKRVPCWCGYTLAMISTGSADVILAARDIEGMEEVVAEMSFEYYWHDWPVNFGMVLQAILYGPYSIAVAEELFQFQ